VGRYLSNTSLEHLRRRQGTSAGAGRLLGAGPSVAVVDADGVLIVPNACRVGQEEPEAQAEHRQSLEEHTAHQSTAHSSPCLHFNISRFFHGVPCSSSCQSGHDGKLQLPDVWQRVCARLGTYTGPVRLRQFPHSRCREVIRSGGSGEPGWQAVQIDQGHADGVGERCDTGLARACTTVPSYNSMSVKATSDLPETLSFSRSALSASSSGEPESLLGFDALESWRSGSESSEVFPVKSSRRVSRRDSKASREVK